MTTSSEAEIASSLVDWRNLSIEEGSGISRQDWPAVARCQNAKEVLAKKLFHHGASWDEQHGCRAEGSWRERFARELRSLFELERRNDACLRATRSAAAAEFEQLQSTDRNLRAVRNSYSRAPENSWQSYS